MKAPQYWLVKSEPTTYGIAHLKQDGKTAWTGVRNFQARNFMKAMRKGDKVLFYHSNCDVPGVYGLATVSGEAGPDETQFDKKSHYYEPRATREKPVWECASIKFAKAFKQPVTLSELRLDPQTATMMILEKGSRLSVTPVSEGEFKRVEALGK